jgi:plastocyanin
MLSRKHIVLLSSLLILAACGGKKEGGSAASSESSTATAQNPVDAATAANISGTIKFTGAKPKAKKIQMSADAYCKTQHPTSVDAEDVVVNPNGTLKNVYVYVKSGLPADMKFPTPSTPAVLDQHGCTYHPHVLAVQAGQEISILNSDGVLHNINARPKNNQGFNIGQPIKDMKTAKSFANPEVMIPVKCDVHPWMGGYIGVQTHPFASVSDDSGAFSLNNLPPGTYEIEAWHEVYGVSKQTVTVGAKENKTITFTFKGA